MTKIAIVHDWLVSYAGSERVLEQMIRCYPNADVFSLIEYLLPPDRDLLRGKTVQTSFIQMLPFAQTRYRTYLPLMPLAVEQFDLSAYELVISSSHAVAKGVITGPDQLHICMCYSPMRYAWDLQHQYLAEAGLTRGMKSWLVRWLLHKIRIWDGRTANGVDQFIAISKFIARRIEKIYRRESTVIYPPVDLDRFGLRREKEEFYLTASRFVPYKKIDLIVRAFGEMPEKSLIVIGDGPDFEKVKSYAKANVTMLGFQDSAALCDHMQRAKAFVFAAEEDFGIAPLEAQACGTPVIAFGKGGALETIAGLQGPCPTGVFFDEQSERSIIDAVSRFEAANPKISADDCRENAMRFSTERFREEFVHFVEKCSADWRLGRGS